MSKPVSYCWIYQGAGAFRVLCAASPLFLAAQGQAQTDPPEQTGPVQTNAAETKASPENNAPTSARPPINWFYRYMKDWSVLADPALRTDPFDPIKYIPIGSDPKTYLSLGITTRERFESVSYRLTPVQPDNYLIDRMQLHADLISDLIFRYSRRQSMPGPPERRCSHPSIRTDWIWSRHLSPPIFP